MTIPTWSQILRSSELVPGQPISANLLGRIYSNIFAVFQLDPDNATVPSYSLPPSSIQAQSFGTWYAASGVTSAEHIVSVTTASLETIDLPPPPEDQSESMYSLSNHINFFDTSGPSLQLSMVVLDIHAVYASGNPTGVSVSIQAQWDGTITTTVLPLDNAFHAVASHAPASVTGRARQSGSNVYLTFQALSSGTADVVVNIPYCRKAFVSKA